MVDPPYQYRRQEIRSQNPKIAEAIRQLAYLGQEPPNIEADPLDSNLARDRGLIRSRGSCFWGRIEPLSPPPP